MGSFNIAFKRSAEKELRQISPPHLALMMKKIAELSDNPYPHGTKLLKGENRYFRLRQGDYRIVYEVIAEEHKIVIIKIGHRREIYN